MGLAIIYQELNLVNTMTVGENVFLGRFSESGGRKGVHAKARVLLDSIGSKVSTHKQVSELSVSDKQMVEIAKALSFDSKLIIMDEPSSSLTADEMDKLVADHPRPEEQGHRDHLHLAQAGRDLRFLRCGHGHARRSRDRHPAP